MATTVQPRVTIVGAGVLGLSTAHVLQRRHPSMSVTIVAAEIPSLPSTWTTSTRPSAKYASMWAGAHYRPIPRSTRQLDEEADLAFRTAELMYEIADTVPESESGVSRMPAKEFLEKAPPENLRLTTGEPYAGPSDEFRVLDNEELPSGAVWGCEYQAYCVNVHKYCKWMMGQFLESGGSLVQKELGTLEDAFAEASGSKPELVINCSGTNFGRDPKMKIIRGQTVLVRNEYGKTITRQTSDGGWSFLIPRPGGGGTVVGGTKEIGDVETEARPETRQKLLAEAAKAFPDFVSEVSEFDVIMDNVGQRPWREGGLRIEVEMLAEQQKVVHGYGAGGRGYELSWGVAEKIADLCEPSAA